ncbi:hypothetical protein FZEAL_10163 [Fusarium zealandicum]|uniref:Uncharacterized protein n=1 Tax=Fusarium zealandicum TaxID=1053134 RepID=A0A8H4U599_9HYPO|nr:hypothetical protein FZEAL_10163 [Fusarium zealandicum]
MSSHCIFCRHQLILEAPTVPLAAFYPAELWETDAIIFHNQKPHGPRLCISALRSQLRGMTVNHNGAYWELLSSRPESNERHRLHEPIFLAHVCCWQVARQLLPNLSLTQAYKLGQQTKRMLQSECWKSLPMPGYEFHSSLRKKQRKRLRKSFESIFIIPEYVNSEGSDTSQLLSRCAQLPTELHRGILKNVGHGLGRCLINASHVVSSVAGLVNPQPDVPSVSTELLQTSTQDGSQGSKTWLSVPLTYIFGHAYIRNLEMVSGGDHDDTRESAILIRHDAAVIGVKFVLGLHALSAICLIYDDGGYSPWLGSPSNGWFGSEYGPSLDRLWDLKVTKVSFDNPQETTHPAWPTRALWDIEPKLGTADTIQVADTTASTKTLADYPGFRLCHYLPLEVNGKYATGLQICLSSVGSLCRATVLHGDSGPHFSVGSQSGDSYYFHIHPEERISFLALLTLSTRPSNTMHSPGLLIQTSFGRSTFCGSTSMMRRRLMPGASWTFVTPDNSGDVTGLVFDLFTRSCHHLRSVGAIVRPSGRPASTPMWNVPNRRLLSPLFECTEMGGLTTASLSEVFKLEVQRNLSAKPTGMRIHHFDASVEILGKWDLANLDIVEIYNCATNGPLSTVSFHYQWNKNIVTSNHLVKIAVGEPLAEDDKVFTWSTHEDRDLCWCFNRGDSRVMPWESLHVEVSTPEGTDRWEVHEILSPYQERQLILSPPAMIE